MIRVPGFEATVLEPGRFEPRRVRFRFDRPLEDASHLFVIGEGLSLEPWPLPAIGESRDLPARSLLTGE